jgi:hypothetical protein
MSLKQERRGLPRWLTPAFYKCDQANTQAKQDQPVQGTSHWSQGLKPQDWSDIHDNARVSHRVYTNVATWIKHTIDGLTTDGAPKLVDMQGDRCYQLSRPKCRNAKGVIATRYVAVPIGRDKEGHLVREYAHRLVAWLDATLENRGSVAMHVGDGPSQGCNTKWCVNRNHLEWGSQGENAQDHAQRQRRGGGSRR